MWGATRIILLDNSAWTIVYVHEHAAVSYSFTYALRLFSATVWHNTQSACTHKLQTHTHTHSALSPDTWGRVEVFPCPPCPFCSSWTSPTGWAVNRPKVPQNLHTLTHRYIQKHICMHTHRTILRCLLWPATTYSNCLSPQWDGAHQLDSLNRDEATASFSIQADYICKMS